MEFQWRSDFAKGVLLQRRQFDDLVRVPFRPELGLSGPRFRSDADSELVEPEPLPDCQPFVDDSRLLLDELLVAVRGGADPKTTAFDHLRSVRLVESCIASIESGSWIQPAKHEGPLSIDDSIDEYEDGSILE